MRSYIDRLAKVEAKLAARQPERRVERYIIDFPTEAQRAERIAGIVAHSDENVLQIFRVIVSPAWRLPYRQYGGGSGIRAPAFVDPHLVDR